MTDINKLKELAERYIANPSGAGGEDSAFRAAANPQAILGLLERLRLTELKGLMDAQRNMDLIKDIGRIKSQNDLMLNAIVKSRTALMVGRPTSKVAGQKYTEAFAAIVAALEGATQ